MLNTLPKFLMKICSDLRFGVRCLEGFADTKASRFAKNVISTSVRIMGGRTQQMFRVDFIRLSFPICQKV